MEHKNTMKKSKDIYICGSGGTAREVYGILKSLGLHTHVKGFIVGNGYPIKKTTLFSVAVLHEKDSDIYSSPSECFMAVGTPEKKIWVADMQKKGAHFMSVVHPSSVALEGSHNGEGTIIFPGVFMTTNITIGDFTIINTGSTIGHDTKIGAYSHISPGVHIAGNVRIGNNTWVGIGTTIIQNISIGNNCFIGAGSVVTEDISDGHLSYGVPAKPVRQITPKDLNMLLKITI